MDEQQKQQESEQVPPAASTSSAGSQQSASDDLKKAADRAKAATQGFSFEKLFSGRLDAMNYLYGVLGSIVLGLVLGMVPLVGWIISLALLVLGFGTTIRRLHDINITGFASLILIVPFLGLFMVIYLCWKHGDQGSNQYGDAPNKQRDVLKAILNT